MIANKLEEPDLATTRGVTRNYPGLVHTSKNIKGSHVSVAALAIRLRQIVQMVAFRRDCTPRVSGRDWKKRA